MSDSTPFALDEIGFAAHFSAALSELNTDLSPARVAIAHGQSYVLWTADGIKTGILVGRRIADWSASPERPQVGDWVAVDTKTHADACSIEHVLPRRTCLMRMAAGNRAVPQVLAANVDVVGVVSAFGGSNLASQHRLINEGRLRRYLAAIQQSGARPLLIVNKSDLRNPAEDLTALTAEFPDVPLVLTSATSRVGLGGLSEWLKPAATLALIGMSGVGKSTLVNALLNRDAQRTGEIREADARGRHTTVHRELFRLDSGALLIDMPGTREFAVWGGDEKVEHPRGARHSKQRKR